MKHGVVVASSDAMRGSLTAYPMKMKGQHTNKK